MDSRVQPGSPKAGQWPCGVGVAGSTHGGHSTRLEFQPRMGVGAAGNMVGRQ